MSDDLQDRRERQVVESLSDRQALRNLGVSEEWIRQCAELVDTYQQLQRQLSDLEGRLSSSQGDSPHDTVVF